MNCLPGEHVWVGGMCYVSNEDASSVAQERNDKGIQPLECEACGKVFEEGDQWDD